MMYDMCVQNPRLAAAISAEEQNLEAQASKLRTAAAETQTKLSRQGMLERVRNLAFKQSVSGCCSSYRPQLLGTVACASEIWLVLSTSHQKRLCCHVAVCSWCTGPSSVGSVLFVRRDWLFFQIVEVDFAGGL